MLVLCVTDSFFFWCSGPVSNYALFIAEDDGSPDSDFPCLEPRETVGKFGFTTLALVRTSNVVKEQSNKEAESNEAALANTPQNNVVKPVVEEQQNAVLESTDFHSFKGFLLHKVRPKTEITLGNSFFQFPVLLLTRTVS